MRALSAFIRAAEGLTRFIGECAAWLTLATVLICALVVVLRYAFGIGHIWMQELYVWTHAVAFMLGAGYTYMLDKHVRVDVLATMRSPRRRAVIEIASTVVFLFPWIAVLSYFSWEYVVASWKLWEESSQVGGMPGLYVMKSVIIVFAFLMLLQGLANVARSTLVLASRDDLLPMTPGTDGNVPGH